MTLQRFLAAALIFFCSAGAPGLGGLFASGREGHGDPPRAAIRFNTGWEFTRIGAKEDTLHPPARTGLMGKNWKDQFMIEFVDTAGAADTASGGASLLRELSKLRGRTWEPVTLPHTAKIEPLVVKDPWEGTAYYRKTFTLNRAYRGRRVSLEFEGAMQLCEVWFNGAHVFTHSGGYLPFTVDITARAVYGGRNSVLLKVDNRDNPLIPPGKPVRRLDFLYYSGIYRDVWLRVKGPLHITDPLTANIICGGGIFVTYSEVSEDSARVNVRVHVKNEDTRERSFTLAGELTDGAGHGAASASGTEVRLAPGGDQQIQLTFLLSHPHLWHPDHPYLYTLRTSLRSAGELVDEERTRVGIRSFRVSRAEGLKINGRPFRIRGTDRHMAYPWIGNALSDNASYRDLWLIKNAGMNCVRLAHYPQDPSVLDACDELGLLALDCIPGWQFFNKNQVFVDRVFRDIRMMIRRDRNHPCVFLWEVSLNETYPPAEFRCAQAETARSEFMGEDFLTSGDSYFTRGCWDVPYDDWDEDTKGRDNNTYPDRPFLIREYGDYEFGGGSSTTRTLRGGGEAAMLQQAWNLQWSHNRNRLLYPRCLGDLNWAMFDGVAGGSPGIEGWGPADIVRLPKFAYYFFQSQRDPSLKQPLDIESGPMVYPATYWMKRSGPGKVVVYSNCEGVELLVNGRSLGVRKPDSGPDTPYGTDYDRGGRPFDGGNCRNIAHAPFTFMDVPFEAGELKAVGFIAGKKAAERSVFTPGEPARLALEVAEGPRPITADGSDAVFVRARVLDSRGHPVPDAVNPVRFSVGGSGRILSPALVNAEAGIATVLLASETRAGTITIRASSAGLLGAVKTISSGKNPENTNIGR